MLAAPAIQDEVNYLPKFRMDILRGNRADSAEAIGAWGSKGRTYLTDDFLEEGVRGYSNRHAL